MSKELEEAIKRFETYCLFNSEQFKKDFELIKSALERNEKLEKALKIIAKKKIRIDLEVKPFNNYKEYVEYWNIKEGSFYGLTETEFNLLKEMIK